MTEVKERIRKANIENLLRGTSYTRVAGIVQEVEKGRLQGEDAIADLRMSWGLFRDYVGTDLRKTIDKLKEDPEGNTDLDEGEVLSVVDPFTWEEEVKDWDESEIVDRLNLSANVLRNTLVSARKRNGYSGGFEVTEVDESDLRREYMKVSSN